MLEKDYDAIFVGTGAPRGRDLPKLEGRQLMMVIAPKKRK